MLEFTIFYLDILPQSISIVLQHQVADGVQSVLSLAAQITEAFHLYLPIYTHHVHKQSHGLWWPPLFGRHVTFPWSTNHCTIATHSWNLGASSLLIKMLSLLFPHLACILLLSWSTKSHKCVPNHVVYSRLTYDVRTVFVYLLLWIRELEASRLPLKHAHYWYHAIRAVTAHLSVGPEIRQQYSRTTWCDALIMWVSTWIWFVLGWIWHVLVWILPLYIFLLLPLNTRSIMSKVLQIHH